MEKRECIGQVKHGTVRHHYGLVDAGWGDEGKTSAGKTG
jgi:hypothetical protein